MKKKTSNTITNFIFDVTVPKSDLVLMIKPNAFNFSRRKRDRDVESNVFIWNTNKRECVRHTLLAYFEAAHQDMHNIGITPKLEIGKRGPMGFPRHRSRHGTTHIEWSSFIYSLQKTLTFSYVGDVCVLCTCTLYVQYKEDLTRQMWTIRIFGRHN